ncbi:MAG TPA: ABC transporter permease [Acetobacteraceae bacterium]|nr:ABC transporter permease [Acetobacteraceae bacterium]
MSFVLAQFLTGLASAASLFLAASGLSLIFGVSRVVNFAHGAFYMLGAYIAYTLTTHLAGSAVGFWAAVLLAALATAAIGTLMEITLLRRIYRAPPLFQLLATFGVALMAEDLVLLIWGPSDLLGPRAPGLSGAFHILGAPLPRYDALLIVVGPSVLGLLWLLLHRTRWGRMLRAATEDREMVAVLGINQKWLFTGAFALGIFLAGLGGALQIPRESVSHDMDLGIIVEVFVIVVIGGLGSIPGAFLAALLVSELNVFGIMLLPTASLVLVFAVMAAVLILRPYGLLGAPEAMRAAGEWAGRVWKPMPRGARLLAPAALLLAASAPLWLGGYALSVGAEILIAAIFAASLQFLMSVGGQASFGHAAYFGLGAYGAAMATAAGLGMPASLLIGIAASLAGGIAFGWFCVRLAGVYFAMLTLAFAQILWTVVFQWVDVTGGDNGILNVWPARWASSAAHFYWLTLAAMAGSVLLLRIVAFSPFGYALRATRDSPLRAAAIGIDVSRTRWLAFALAAAFAGLAGALFAFLKGSVFPDSLGIGVSIDGLVMVLLGGVGTISGAIAGAAVYKALSIWLMTETDYSRLVLGALIVVLVVAFPRGIAGSWQTLVPSLRLALRRRGALAERGA